MKGDAKVARDVARATGGLAGGSGIGPQKQVGGDDLVTLLGEQGSYRPALAESWALSDDARTWTFNLRTPVVCHNGDTLVAEDVIAAIERVCSPGIGGELGTSGLYRSYLGDAEYEALDEHTVRLTTPTPMPDLLDILMKMPVLPRRAFAGLPEKPVGSGPFRFVEAGEDQIVMETFESYWGAKPPVGRVVWRSESDAGKRLDALLTGRADLVTDVAPEDSERIKASGKAEIVTAQSSVCATFMCNIFSGVCQDRRVRQALNYALDIPELVARVMGGVGNPLNGPFTPLHLGHDPGTQPYPYDPEKAKALLAEAGYAGGMELVLDVPTTIPDEAPFLAKCMAEQYARVGITTKIKEYTDRPGYANMVKNKQINDACCFDSSPQSTYQVLREKFHSGEEGPWWQGYANPEVNALIDKAQVTPDVASRRDLYRQAYRIIRDDAPWIFLYSHVYTWGLGPAAQGWTAGFDGLIRLV